MKKGNEKRWMETEDRTMSQQEDQILGTIPMAIIGQEDREKAIGVC